MADLVNDLQSSSTTRLVGGDEAHAVDVVEYDNGEKRVLVDSKTSPIPIGELFTEKLELAGSTDMAVNGRNTAKVFRLPLVDNKDRIVTSINIYGRDLGIKYGRFLGISELSNGVLLKMKSEDKTFSFLPVKTTDDLRNVITVSPSDFIIDISSGEDSFTASFIPAAPFYIKRSVDYNTPDYIEIIIQDNLNRVRYLECIVKGTFEL